MLSYAGNPLPHTQYIPFDLGALEITEVCSSFQTEEEKT